MEFYKIICLAFVGFLLAVQLRGIGSGIWIYLSIAISICVLCYSVDRLTFVMDYLKDVIRYIGLEEEYFIILFKIIGISYLCEITSNICKESGFFAIGSQIEIGGKLTIMVLSIPVLIAIVDMVTGAL